MCSCVKSIAITARETSGGSAVVSLRHNETICNLRALVAVRFEQAIDMIVLIFGGQVLNDVGTIDSQGIIEGVTVHVLFRQLRHSNEQQSSSNQELNVEARLKAKSRLGILKHADLYKPLLNDPTSLRHLLYGNERIRMLLDENTSFRHYLSSDRNLLDFFSTIFNPAKMEELGRKQDIYMMRLECAPGAHSMLSKMHCFLHQLQEDSVAATYQKFDAKHAVDNPQRGRENCLPLPNPWQRHEVAQVELQLSDVCSRRVERMVSDLKQKYVNLVQCLKLDDLDKTLQQARDLNLLADNAQRELEASGHSTAELRNPRFDRSLNIFDFMSTNDSRWEQHFRVQLLELDALGHTNQQRNISALLMSFGDVKLACKLLQKWNR